jgi:nucleotide-binding universal stress UspA family protein
MSMKKSRKTNEMSTERTSIGRILVALDASKQSQAALEAAAAMAERMQAEVEGLFIEDIDLLHLAELPFTNEIGFTSRSRRLLDSNIMTRALRARASLARKSFEDIARKHKLVSSFRVARGKVLAELLAATEQVDLIAVGTTGHKIGRGDKPGTTYAGVVESCRCSVLLLQEHITPGRSVITVFDGSDASARSLERAQSLATAQGESMVALLFGEKNEAEKLKQQVTDLVDDPANVTFVSLSESQLDELPAVLEQRQCGFLLLPRAISQNDARLNVERLSQLRCPVMLVS